MPLVSAMNQFSPAASSIYMEETGDLVRSLLDAFNRRSILTLLHDAVEEKRTRDVSDVYPGQN